MKRLGCFWTCLIVLAAVVAIVVGGGYYTLFHTSMPLKAIAAAISQDGKVMIEGVTGTLNSGFHVDRVEIKDAGQPPSELEDISFRYRGRGWPGGGERVIIEEASVGKATVYVDLPSLSTDGAAYEARPSGQVSDVAPGPENAGANRGPVRLGSEFQFLQINRASLGNLIIRDLKQNFELSVPKIEWTGFRIENGKIDPGALTVDSDRLEVKTLPGRTVQVLDQTIAFQKCIVATVSPSLHEMLRDTIDAELDLSLSLRGLKVARLQAFDAVLVAFFDNATRSGFVRISQLDLGRYVTGEPFDLPKQFALDVAFTTQKSPREHEIDLRSGSFQLGVVEFVLEPQQVLVAERNPQPVTVRAKGQQDGAEYLFDLTISPSDRPLRQRLSSNPPQEPREVLARVFLGKSPAELTDDEAAQIELKLPLYTDTAGTSTAATNAEAEAESEVNTPTEPETATGRELTEFRGVPADDPEHDAIIGPSG